MKSMKRILSVVLAVVMLATIVVVPVSAEVSSDAQTCEILNVLRGDGSGVTEVYLAKNTNRSQGAKILLRLMGLEVEADAYTGTVTFSDASDATAYWQPMLAYLKANPGVGFQGYPDGTFAPNRIMTAQEIYKVLLVSLGYVENVDFTWSSVFSFAATKGMTALQGTEQITNDNLATALVEALTTTKKDGQELIVFLIDEGVVSLSDAQDANLVPTTLTIMDAFASGSKEITVTLNMSAPEGTAVTFKKGNINWPVNLEWESTRKVIKFTRTFKFTPGDYTVTVGESTMTLTVGTETIMGIDIGADYIFPLANQDLIISLYNQYGEPMVITNTTVLVMNINKGTSLPPQNMGTTIKVDASNSAVVEGGDTLNIIVMHTPTGINQTKTITVYEEPEIKSLYISGLEIAGSAYRIEENTTGHKLTLEAIDQYGNPYVLTNADILMGGQIILTNSNDLSVPSGTFVIDSEGNLVFNALVAGTSIITFIVPTESIIRTYTVTVSEPTEIETLVISTGTGMVTSGTRYDLTALAYDQLGSPIPLLGNFNFANFTIFSTNTLVVSNTGIQYDAAAGVLYVLPGMPGTTTITYYYSGIYKGNLLVTVYDAPEPQAITEINFPTKFEEGASKGITLDDVVVRDQYGDIFDLSGTNYRIQIERTSGTTMSAGTIVPATFTATATEGTTTFIMRINHLTNGIVAGSENAIAIEVVETEDITNFAFDPVGIMYAGGIGGTNYYRTLVINGKIGSDIVVLAGGAVPSSITLVSSTNSDFVLDGGTLELYANAEGQTTIKAWMGGEVKAQITITASSEAPEVTTMVFTENPHTMGNSTTFDVKTIFTIKDQYGVDITSSASINYYSSVHTVATINSSGIITSYAIDGTTSISAVETSGTGSAILTLIVN